MADFARVAVVTGASSGIGLAVAVALRDAGWVVLAVSRREPSVTAPTDARPGRIVHVPVDLTQDSAPARVVEALAAAGGPCRALVHCAGIVERGSFSAVGPEGLDRQYAVNVRAPYALTAALLPELTRAGGDIVFVNSTQGLAAGSDAVAYAASKHALKAIADGLRAELRDSGVRVCSVYPGRTDTEGQREIFRYEGRPYAPASLLKPETVAMFIVRALELPAEAELVDLTIRPSRPT